MAVLVRALHVFDGNAPEETVSMLLESDSDMGDGEIVLSYLKSKSIEGNGKKQKKEKIGKKDAEKRRWRVDVWIKRRVSWWWVNTENTVVQSYTMKRNLFL